MAKKYKKPKPVKVKKVMRKLRKVTKKNAKGETKKNRAYAKYQKVLKDDKGKIIKKKDGTAQNVFAGKKPKRARAGKQTKPTTKVGRRSLKKLD